jgi:hypothetical protein
MASERTIKTVLVIDDEELIRILTQSFLTQLGYQAVLATSGEEGVLLFKKNPEKFQLVLSDITMPGIDGIETVRRLRKIDPSLKAIISSGYSSERIDSIPKDAIFLAKPYSIAELKSAISRISGGN